MRFVDLFRFAVGALVGHRLRASLSVAGVAIGIAAVVALTGLGEGARRYVTSEFAALGSNLLIVLPGKVETTGAAPFGGTTHDLTLDDFRAIQTRVPEVRQAAPLAVGTEAVRFGDRRRSVPVLGTTAEFQQVRKMEVAAGRFLAADDAEQGRAEVVLGVKVTKELFGSENPLGAVVRVGPWRLRVVGVLAPRGRSVGGFDLDDVAFVPVRTCMRMFNRATLFRILAEARSPEDMAAGRLAVLDLLAARHRAEDVTVITQDAVISSLSAILNALTLALAGIASVSLSVAGVGIMNVMLVSVTERRAEIGVLKAVGAKDSQVLAAFLTESALLSSCGGLLGVATGALALRIFVRIYPSFPAFPPGWAVAASLAVSLLVGIGFGVLPARRATRLDPVAALARR